MQFDQLLRRVFWRVRRHIWPGADHDPVYSVEAPSPPRPEERPASGTFRRTAIAFVATLSALGAGYVFLAALNSRTTLDTGRPAVVDATGSRALTASLALLGATSTAPSYGEAIPLLPNGRLLRSERIAAGKRDVAAAFVRLAAAGPQRDDPALADALDAINGDDGEAARDALIRFNVGVAGKWYGPDRSSAAVAAIANAVAENCEAEEAALRQAASENAGGMAGPRLQGAFSYSRGLAYGWLMVLRGALADAPDIAGATVVEAAIPLDALAAAAEHQPLFLFNGSDREPWAPAHIEIQIAAFARAAAGARALALAADNAAVAAP